MRIVPHWLNELSDADSVDILRELARSETELAGVAGEDLLVLIRDAYKPGPNGLKALIEYSVDPRDEKLSWGFYLEYPPPEDVVDVPVWAHKAHMEFRARTYSRLVQAAAFFSKNQSIEAGFDKEKRAWDKFVEAERLCRETNDILKLRRKGALQFRAPIEHALTRARDIIARILGPVPAYSELDMRFGPGATRATTKREASIRRKLAETLQCSKELVQAAPAILGELPHLTDIHSIGLLEAEDGSELWDLVNLEVIPAKLSFVPKNAKTHRSVTVEPGLNVMVQLGIGNYMSKRLAAFGVDISDQSRNQRAAMKGSFTGDLATLDLSSASDTVALELVYELLPLDWADFLNRARTSDVETPSGLIRQEKFSAMGNGYTFPLETLIFYSLARSVAKYPRSVKAYGDDIVCHASDTEAVVEMLVACGFVVNLDKSFWYKDEVLGQFRESCGKDYYSGIDVRPVFVKERLSVQSLFVLHNFYARRLDSVMTDRIRNWIPAALAIYGPDGYGDGHLLGDHNRRRPASIVQKGYGGYFFDTFITGSARDTIPLSFGEWVVPLYTVYRSGDNPVRDSLPSTNSRGVACLPLPGVRGYKKISIYTLGG